MKITLFHCSFLYTGGGERIVLEHITHFKRAGYDVECYVPVIDTKASFPDIIDSFHIKTLFPQLPKWIPYRHAILLILTCLFAPLVWYKFRKTDYFFGENQPGAWLAFVFATILRKPYSVYLNQPNRIIYPRPVDRAFGWKATVKDYHLLFTFFQIIKPFLAYLDKISVIHSQHLFTNGSYIGSIIQNIYGKAVVDSPAAAEIHPEPTPDTDYWRGSLILNEKIIQKPYALITNRHDPQKRFDYVIQAMKYAPNDTYLVIPGEYTSHTFVLIDIAKALGIDHRVLFLGPVTQAELQLLYSNACVYCYPSPEEDYGLGPVEAGGWSLPTVAWNAAGPTVTVSHEVTGFLAPTFSVEDYGKYMRMLFEDRTLRMQMGKASRKRVVDQFSWDVHTRNILKHLNI